MIQEYIEKNRDTIAILAKRMMIAGWVLLILGPVILSFSAIQLMRTSSTGSTRPFVVLQVIDPFLLGLLLLVFGQFLRYELGLEKQAGWFLSNGVIILRIYAAATVVFAIIQPLIFISVDLIPKLGRQFLVFAGPYLYRIVVGVVKVLLLWAAASMLKMMMSGTRENARPNV